MDQSHPDSTSEQKRRLRRELRAGPAEGHAERAAHPSARICAHVVAAPFFRRAGVVMAYAPVEGEVDVRPLALECLRQGKRLCLPRVDWEARRLTAVAVADLEGDLTPSRHGIFEPRADLPATGASELDLVIVPGLAFDRAGGRLGRGAGFYDRFLADPALRAVTCGVAFGAAVMEHLPTDAHDAPVDAVATEDGVIAARPERLGPG